ncbi:hypothetical protein TSUD_398850 [Trifolium subterraneum]|uniref:Disease resistance protein At4g27190-like leucine-rich repeats domain-containing protein n=1 Tax=Trifolium subterraneum TaxID=3900 RepID=A0A2Z6PEN1_TRISU|nr:hypothetical protein TSUD_398850 [Trifolium subterraneum]
MRNKRDVQSWKYGLQRLQSNAGVEMDAKTYFALELSYDFLESDEMRDLFLLFALRLGNDVEYCLKLAMGLDILNHIITMDDARNRLHIKIKSLEAAGLLEVKTSGYIQMHDFVRDFANSVARRDKHVFLRKQPNEDWPNKDFLKRCTHIVLDSVHIHRLPQTFDCPNIKLFDLVSVDRSLEIPDEFFEDMRSLTMLDLTSLNLSSLPTSFRFLTHLQTLCLEYCVLEDMAAIEGLKNLQILSLVKSSMIKLPREIGRLTQLRMLDLSSSGIEVVPPNIISNLTKLEELLMGNTTINWEDANSTVQSENASIAELQKLPNLTALELQIREICMLPRDLRLMFEKLEIYKIAIGNVAFSKLDTLKLSSLLNLNKIWDSNYDSMHNLTSLIVDNCGGLKFLFSSTVVGSFKNLKHLEISNCAMMEEIIAKEGNGASEEVHFLKLEKIIVKDMDNLKTIWHHQFETVKMLQVNNCDKIVVVFPSSMQKTYNKLEMLEVTNCALVEEIFELSFKESSSVEDTTHLKEVTITGLPKLKKIWTAQSLNKLTILEVAFGKFKYLALSDYPEMKDLWYGQNVFCNLKHLVVHKCDFLSRVLFPSNIMQVLYGLEELEVRDCDSLEAVFDVKVKVSACQSLLYIFPLSLCEDLEHLEVLEIESCRVEQIVGMEEGPMEHSFNFPQLNKLRLFNLTKLTSFYCGKHSLDCPSLKVLDVYRCDAFNNLDLFSIEKLKHIWQDDFPMNHPLLQDLNELWLWDCPSLINLAPSSTSFTNLTRLHVENCKELIYLITSSTAKSLIQLRTLKIKNCEKMLDVVRIDGEKADQEDIIFENLEYMEFTSLSSLRSFCYGNQTFIFPSLQSLTAQECPQMEIFCYGNQTFIFPYLTKIEVGEATFRWRGDINTTIQHLFQEKKVLRSNALNKTILSSHLQDDEVGGQEGIGAGPEK